MVKYRQTGDELLGHLRDQITFMQQSADAYDRDFKGEAKRLAIAIRILVHDTKNCSALLTQLDRMDILFYDSAATFDPTNLVTSNCLTVTKISNEGAEYVAPLDNLPPTRRKNRKVSFGRWWNRSIIYKDNAGGAFNRRDLVLNLADTEGGAHIDPTLNQAYANLSRFNSLAWRYVNGRGKDEPLPSPVPPAIRQIAHEVLKTLKDEFPELF